MSKVPKSKVAKKKSTVTAKELKAWLAGIQEFQPAGWTPSKEQWDAILKKIMILEEDVTYASDEPGTREDYSYTPAPYVATYTPPQAHTPTGRLGGNNASTGDEYVAHVPLAPGEGIVQVRIDPDGGSNQNAFA